MKKLLLCALFTFGVLNTANAQRDFKVFNFGAKVGVNVSSVSGLSDIVGAMKSGFTGGLFFEFRPIKLIGVSAEVLYSDQGFKTEPFNVPGLSINDWTLDVGLGYIDVPILAKVYITTGLSVNVGIMPSFLVTSSVGKEASSLFDFNSASFAIPVGLSYQFKFGLILDARYKFGLTNINSIEDIGTINHNTSFDVKNESFCFMVGWRF